MKGRPSLLLLCVIVVAVIVILASSLHDVQFRPGRALSVVQPSTATILLPILKVASETPLWRLLLLWVAFVVNLVLFFYFLPPALRKKIVRQVLGIAIGSLALMLALRYQVLKLPGFTADPASAQGGVQVGADPGSGFPVFHRPPIAAWTLYLVSLTALLGIFIFLYFIYERWKRIRISQLSPLTAIAGITEASLHDLASGRDWGDVIIKTYAEMSNALSARRGLQRGASVTAREFADRLVHAGLPAEAIERLTALFEMVRYGERRSSESDTKAALDCLNTILLACGTTT